ncbi:MAG: oligosaccharide repeat unit polymerase [Actinobacteria bacterium]|nr:oligosaccharide repeat unit polymerase [Actinomycetota bacterium]
MGLLGAIFVLPLLLVVTWRLDGGEFGLMTLLAARWWGLITAYLLVPYQYVEIGSRTWAVVGLSLGSILLGYFVIVSKRRDAPTKDLKFDGNGALYWRAYWSIFLVGAALFTIYLFNLLSRFGLSTMLESSHTIRLAISRGSIPTGFHYFYAFEMILPLAAFGYVRLRGEKPRLFALVASAGFASAALLATTARTNLTKSIIWALIVLYVSSDRLRFRVRDLRLVFTMIAVVLAVFSLMGNMLGKSYENSTLVSSGLVDISGPLQEVALPLHYSAGPLPTLDRLLEDTDPPVTWGALTFHPLAKVAEVFLPDYDAPSHIGEFYEIPYRFNVATFIDIGYKDFRLFGVALTGWILGILAGVVTLHARRMNKGSVCWTFAFSIVALVIFASPSSASYIKFSYWIQTAVLLWLGAKVDVAPKSSKALLHRSSPALSWSAPK